MLRFLWACESKATQKFDKGISVDLQQNVSAEARQNASVAILPVVATNATCSVRVAAVTKGGVGPFSSPVEVFIPGSGEFGSVMEGRLSQPEGTPQKVAVKTMKLDNFSQREIEEFLSEAACMKDFDHPNVIKLLGVCIELSSQQVPKPMVILPFMKYGDLHSFLLRSRLEMAPQNIKRTVVVLLPAFVRYEIMSACWRANPAARPTFSQLKVHLEKLLENLPTIRGSRDVIYINTSLPEESPDSTQDSGFPQADSDLDPGDVAEPCSPGVEAALVAVDVHHNEQWGTRYVLEEQLGGPMEEAYVPLLPSGVAGEGSAWTQASTLPSGSSLAPELPCTDSCVEDSEVLL
ncbi:tyrosine-protein kinase mer [Limosa lapponica baueri]|uniref:Tyrosine-protein kinase mer n=1 Tax=Limosa lapponica baueri TaxID=1758121 RepID=A0A2I0THG4_LIMLA|nr:tyrosine-protein kinase mer [Limosa lapponica baueri]